MPDLTLLLQLSPGAGLARAAGRGAIDRMEAAGDAFHARVAETFAAAATLAWVAPTGVATNPVTFRADATSDIVTIKYFADGTFLLGSSTDRANHFPVTYKFSGVGVRRIYVRGYNAAGTQLAGAYKDFTIRDLIANVPYFFQYANQYEPGATCANTTMAMLLKYYGANYTRLTQVKATYDPHRLFNFPQAI